MEARLDYAKLAPDAMRALYSLGAYLAKCGLEHPLLELVKIRASQINGCAYCIDMHTKDARAAGETEQRIYALNAWRETPFFTDRERAALAWTEAVTRIGEGVTDALFAEARRAVLREGAGGPDLGGGRDQRLEPGRDQLPQRARGVSAEEPGRLRAHRPR